jgi:thiosulfate/3-mercaptopyruvate sulfurtransferase
MPFTTLIDVETLERHRRSADWVLLDCRFELGKPAAGEASYREGHLPGARYAHLDRDLAAPIGPTTGRHPLPDPDVFAAKAGAWGIGADTQIVVYDQGNSFFAARAWWVFRWLGHTGVAVLDGGFAAWAAAGMAVDPHPPQCVPQRFSSRPDDRRLVDATHVLGSIGRAESCLVDARGADRYAGENETIDSVGGHVPGAINHHYARNYRSDGRLRDAASLREEWLSTLAGRPAESMVAMCGSGVSACVNLLALEHAGLGGARLYPGSWSEWIRDPSRPIARGP